MLHKGQEKSCSNIFLKFANISRQATGHTRPCKVVAAKPVSAMDWVRVQLILYEVNLSFVSNRPSYIFLKK